MCNIGVNLCALNLPVDAFEHWREGLQRSPVHWDILDNMLETLLGHKDFHSTSLTVFDTPGTSHVLNIRQQSLQVCNLVLGQLPRNPVGVGEVHRAQNALCIRSLLLHSLHETGEWEDLTEGVEIGINIATTPPDSSPGRATLDDLLLQAHQIGKSVYSATNPNNLDQQPSPGVPGREILHPTLLLFPNEVALLPSKIWPSTNGFLPGVPISSTSENSAEDLRIQLLNSSTNVTTSRLLRTWAMRVQTFLEAQPLNDEDHVTPAAVPCSSYQATESLIILASYLALSLHSSPTSYNNLGILLSSIRPTVSRSSAPGSINATTGHKMSRCYFEAGLEVGPQNAHLLTNLGTYWKKEGNYEEAIRYYRLASVRFTVAQAYLEQTLKEIDPNFEGDRDEPTYQKFD